MVEQIQIVPFKLVHCTNALKPASKLLKICISVLPPKPNLPGKANTEINKNSKAITAVMVSMTELLKKTYWNSQIYREVVIAFAIKYHW